MERIPNPEMEQYALDHIANLYNIRKVRDRIHLSTLIYCLTSSYFDFTQPILPTEEEVMLFALGYGLQDVLTPQEAETPVFEKEGIVYSPDYLLQIDGKYFEIKTTRMSYDKPEYPETWIEYIMGGCYIRDINEYELVVLHMMGNWKPPFPKIRAETLRFDQEELLHNWYRTIGRRNMLLSSLEANHVPEPGKWCKDWECKYCRYKVVCDALKLEERDG
jgi:hypothetical protein